MFLPDNDSRPPEQTKVITLMGLSKENVDAHKKPIFMCHVSASEEKLMIGI